MPTIRAAPVVEPATTPAMVATTTTAPVTAAATMTTPATAAVTTIDVTVTAQIPPTERVAHRRHPLRFALSKESEPTQSAKWATDAVSARPPPTTVGSMIAPAPTNRGSNPMVPITRAIDSAQRRLAWWRAAAATDWVRPKIVNAATMKIVPAHVNSGSSAISLIHARAMMPRTAPQEAGGQHRQNGHRPGVHLSDGR